MKSVQVWWAWRQDASALLKGLLDDAECERWTAYHRAADRERFLVGCALVKGAVAARTGLAVGSISVDRTCGRCGEPHGKPRAEGVELSVTHSGDVVGVAIAAIPLGIDVEQVSGSGDPEVLAHFIMSEVEQAAFAGLSGRRRARAVLEAWTRKEAVTKATGDGLGVSFSSLTISAVGSPPRLTAWPYPDDPGTVSLFELDVPDGYVASLAVIGECDAIEVGDGSALLAASL